MSGQNKGSPGSLLVGQGVGDGGGAHSVTFSCLCVSRASHDEKLEPVTSPSPSRCPVLSPWWLGRLFLPLLSPVLLAPPSCFVSHSSFRSSLSVALSGAWPTLVLLLPHPSPACLSLGLGATPPAPPVQELPQDQGFLCHRQLPGPGRVDSWEMLCAGMSVLALVF